MAWNRTSVSMMTFGFVIERFGLFLEIIGHNDSILLHVTKNQFLKHYSGHSRSSTQT